MINVFFSNEGFNGNASITISESDLIGPVPTVPVKKFDYYLLISWLFIIFVSIDFLIRKTKFNHYFLYVINKLNHLMRALTNSNGLLELPEPTQRQMIQDTSNPQINHPHHD